MDSAQEGRNRHSGHSLGNGSMTELRTKPPDASAAKLSEPAPSRTRQFRGTAAGFPRSGLSQWSEGQKSKPAVPRAGVPCITCGTFLPDAVAEKNIFATQPDFRNRRGCKAKLSESGN